MTSIGRKVMSNFLLIALLFSVLLIVSIDRSYATTKADENLVNSVSNPSNGVIKFKITCPANSTVSYTLSLTPSNKKDSIDKKTGSFKNTGKKAVTKTVSYSAKYFSNQYKISAKATIGNARNKNYRTDTDSASSKLVNNHYSNKVTWDDKEIAKYNKGQAVEKLVLIGTGVVIDIFTTKKPVATVLEVYLALNGRNEDYTTKNIQWLPRKGWSWKIYYEKTESGYATYLVVYNDKGKYDTKYKLKTYTYSTITPAIH